MFFVFTIPSYAENFMYTGLTAEKIDPIGYVPGGTGAIGGPVANERLGLASQFVMTDTVHVKDFNINVLVSPFVGTTTFTYKLYNQSTFDYFGNTHINPIPLVSSLVYESKPLSFTATQQDDNAGIYQNYDVRVPFDYVFSPGGYWLAIEGGGYTYVTVIQTYIDPRCYNVIK